MAGLEAMMVLECLAQAYPVWFLHQPELTCGQFVVGYANPSYYPDSAVAQATGNAYVTFARQLKTNVTGGQAFWSTEVGTYWMGSSFRDEFDTSAIASARNVLKPIGKFVGKGIVGVLMGDSGCSLDRSIQSLIPVSATAPAWTESIPQGKQYFYAVGVAPAYYYETSSWTEAERIAFRNLARVVHVDAKSLQKVSTKEGGQEIRNEEVAVTLRNVQTVARWRDLKKEIFYVLVRMPK